MEAEEDRVAHDGGRVVDLVVVQIVDSAAGHFVEEPRPVKGRQHPAVTVGAHAQGCPVGHQQPAGGGLDCRHVPLRKEEDVGRRKSEVAVLGKKRRRFVMRGVAGHDEIRDRPSRAARPGRNLLRQDLKQQCAARPGRSKTSPWADQIPGACPVPRRQGGRRRGRSRAIRPPRAALVPSAALVLGARRADDGPGRSGPPRSAGSACPANSPPDVATRGRGPAGRSRSPRFGT